MPSIADAPIDWTRDASREEVPREVSANLDVQARWSQINRTLFDGTPVEYAIAGIEEILVSRQALLSSGGLDQRFDWKHDFEIARFNHRFHLNNLDYVRNKRLSHLEAWKGWANEAIEYYRTISLNGQKTIYLVHGAVALGGLNILTKDPAPAAGFQLAAKFAVAFASTGIVLVGIGQLIAVYFGTAIAWRIRWKITGDVKWTKVRALNRYLRKYNTYGNWADRAIYASVIWCGVYLAILLILVLSA